MRVKKIILHITEAHGFCHYPVSLSLICFLLMETYALERTQETVEWRDSESAHCRDPCLAMFPAALLTVAKMWSKSGALSMEKQMKNVHVCEGILFSSTAELKYGICGGRMELDRGRISQTLERVQL